MFVNSIPIMELGAILLVGVITFDLLTKDSEIMPIGLIALCISGFQWLISPILTYHSPFNLYPMSVSEDIYLKWTLLGYIGFVAGVYYGRSRLKYKPNVNKLTSHCCCLLKPIKILIIVGALSMLMPVMGSTWSFIKELLGGLFVVGITMLMYAKPQKAIKSVLCAIVFLLLISLRGGMFHNMVVWGIFLLLTLFSIKKYLLTKKLIIIACLFVGLFTLQSIKAVYRSYTWYGKEGYSGNNITLFVNLFYSSLTGNLIETDETDINSRFNQGWIISRIYSHIPQQTDYLYGKTIFEGIESSLLPRFLFPTKKDSGKASIQDFEHFTGYHLSSSTSMGLSIWGEAYGNFGVTGGAIFMFLWGTLISQLLEFIYFLYQRKGYWIFFAPIISFNLIKAEINFLSVFNWTLKSLIFCWAIITLLNKYYPNQDVTNLLQEET